MKHSLEACATACILALGILANTSHAQSAEPTRLAVAVGTQPRSGNPFSSTSIGELAYWSAIYDPLTLVTTKGELLPWLAVSWRQTEPTVWRIVLRENVRFSNGQSLNARAVVVALDYLTSARGKSEPVARDLINVAGARALSESEVEIITTIPDPTLPRRLSLLRLVEPELWAKLGPEGYASQPMGTGPYAIDVVRPERIKAKAVPGSWRPAPTDTLDFVAIGDPSARQMALQVGEADIALNALSPDEFANIRSIGGSIFSDQIPAVVAMILNNVADTPFRDERVRQAVSMAINRDGIVDVLLAGQTKVANQPATTAMFGYNPDIPRVPYDPARAKALLAESGFPDGFAFDMEMPSSTVLYTAAFQTVAADLQKIGVKMTLRLLPQAPFQAKIQNGGWAGAAFAWPFFSPVNDALYSMRQHSCEWAAPWYCDPETSRLIAKATAEENLDTRQSITKDIMKRAHDTVQAVYLYESISFIGLGPRIQDFQADYNFIRYELIKLKQN